MAAPDILSITASSIPEPSNDGSLNFKILNGTNGNYADNQIYCTILGIDPDTHQ